jgi:PhnB protein
MEPPNDEIKISVMLAVPNTPQAVKWYREALGARLLWDLGSVAGLEIGGAPFFLHEPVEHHFRSPRELGATTARVEMFVENPDALIARAVKAGALGGEIKDHDCPWGKHRQGGFTDPFGHRWLVGDKSPLRRYLR